MTFADKVYCTVRRNSLPQPGTKMIVALSGGADSVALLRVLLELGYKCTAAHFDFHLRGGESVRDERFVRNLCRNMNIPLKVAEADTMAYASEKGISLEMAARDLRYGFFGSLSGELCAPVAVAHHRDDNAETLLLNLLRGTGLRGLCGMAYKSGRVCSSGGKPGKFTVVRPLLDVSRREICEYLKGLGQDFVTDSSNLVADVKRNRIRLEVIPMLEKINPSLCDTLQRETAKFAGAYNIYREAVGKILGNLKTNAYGDEILEAAVLRGCASPESVLFEWLSPKGFNETQINKASQNGNAEMKRLESEDHVLYFNSRRYVLLSRESLRECGVVLLERDKKAAVGIAELEIADVQGFPPKEKLVDRFSAYINADIIKFPLVVRRVAEGDRFVPFGMKGSKLVSDYLKDCKVPIEERLRQLVVCSGGKIVWLVGRRVDNRVRVFPDTPNIICISARNKFALCGE